MAASQLIRGRVKRHAISGDELHARIDGLGLTYLAAADKLGVTQDGLYQQMSGPRTVSRETEIIIDQLEELQLLRTRKGQAEPSKGRPTGRRRDLAQDLYPPPRWPERG
jgi:hypothetical protein